MIAEEATTEQASRGLAWSTWVYIAITALLWTAVLWWSWFTPAPETIERVYSRGIYRWFNGTLPGLTEPFGFSIALFIVIVILLGFPLLVAARWVYLRRVKKRSHWAGAAFLLQGLLLLVPLVVCWFVLFWGAGYARPPVEQRLHLDTSEISPEENAALRGAMLEILQRDLVPEDERDVHRAIGSISAAMRRVIGEWDGVPVRLPQDVKRTPPGLLLANGTSGIASPLTLEPHVDGGLPDTALVYVAAHELGHVAGMNVEAEATLAGFAAGLRADDAYARWCVALDIYTDLARQLPAEEMKTAFAELPELAKKDLEAAREAAQKYKIEWFGNISWRMYDSYLKKQGIQEGRKNYGKGISLFVYAWRGGKVAVPGAAPEVEAKTDAAI